MYDVMKAVYESNIPINFKGSMVLKACLLEAGYSEEIRHTVDIDGNWYSDTPPTKEQLISSIQNAVDKYGLNISVSIYRMYDKGRSAGFELTSKDSGEVLFTMDIDVNRPVPSTKIYEIAGVRFRGVSPIHMISDKLVVISTDAVYRRIKDIIDLYYFSHVFSFDTSFILSTLKNDERTLGNFNAFLFHKAELQHSYEKYRFAGNLSKPSFADVYSKVKAYIRDILPPEKSLDYER